MGVDRLIVSHDYIQRHAKCWSEEVGLYISQVMGTTRQMELRCRPSFFFEDFMRVHERLVGWVQDKAGEGHVVASHIATNLAQCLTVYEQGELYRDALAKRATGGAH